MRHIELKEIELSKINLKDRRYDFRFFHNLPDFFVDSIKKLGIISPPLVYLEKNMYYVLDGFRRLDAARLCDIKNVFCQIYKGPKEAWDLAMIVFSIRLSSGLPHILDQATILFRLSESFSHDRIIHTILPVLGYSTSPKVLSRLLPLARMEESIGEALLEGMINQDMALRLMDLKPDARLHIVSLFIYYRYSQSKQFEILEHLLDISTKESRSLIDILKDLGWDAEYQKSAEENRSVEGEIFRRRLREKRFPVLFGLEEQWKHKIKSLHLPPSIMLNPPPYFEGGTFRIRFTFKDIKGFQQKLKELKALGEKDAWIELFSP
jgi:ParB family chromosome partitioning protein